MGDSEQKFDLAFLNKISGGDENFIKEMITTFKELAPEYVEKATLYLENADYDSLSREAHKFLPGVSFLGIKYLEEDIALIEEYAKKHINIEELGSLLQSSIKKIDEIIESFNKEFDLN